jgi:cobalt/nickel transport system permease protein
MHIPDGFIDVPTAAATGAVALGAVAWSVRRTGRSHGERTVPLMGVAAAFIFAAQMLNFPIGAGTSGHFLGALLAAVLLGPWTGMVVMTAVVVVQAVALADGGITALGANVLNMAVVAVLVGYGAFALLKRLLPRGLTGHLIALAVASWLSVVASAAAVAGELALSGTIPLQTGLPAMVSVHMIIGLGEALITTALVTAVLAARPDLVAGFDLPPGTLRGRPAGPRGRAARASWLVVGALVVALALAIFVSPFASRSPDGLASVAAAAGVPNAAQTEVATGDVSAPAAHLSSLAGAVGVVLVLGLVLVAGRVLSRGRARTE